MDFIRVHSRLFAAIFLFAAAAGAEPGVVVIGQAAPEIRAEIAARGWQIREAPDGGGYLIGSISDVLFAASRTPGAWTAALAIGGNPAAAIESNRIFAANLALVPVLWIGPPELESMAGALRSRIPSVEFRPAAGVTVKQAFDWLASREHEPWPQKIDCETGSLEFGRCHWAKIVKLDPSRRNDVLASTRIAPGSGASLALGGFGYDAAAPGPGVLVLLPQNYKGPLKAGDRIVALAGKPIDDSRHYRELMDQVRQEKGTAVLVQRGKERLRIETRVVLPKREETVTGRLQAEHIPDAHEVQVISRGVAAFRLTVPAHWTPAHINWNGNDAGEMSGSGCWEVDETGKAMSCRP